MTGDASTIHVYLGTGDEAKSTGVITRFHLQSFTKLTSTMRSPRPPLYWTTFLVPSSNNLFWSALHIPAHSSLHFRAQDFTFVCPTEIIAFSDRAKVRLPVPYLRPVVFVLLFWYLQGCTLAAERLSFWPTEPGDNGIAPFFLCTVAATEAACRDG